MSNPTSTERAKRFAYLIAEHGNAADNRMFVWEPDEDSVGFDGSIEYADLERILAAVEEGVGNE